MRSCFPVSRILLSPSTLWWIEGIKGARLNKRGNEGERPILEEAKRNLHRLTLITWSFEQIAVEL